MTDTTAPGSRLYTESFYADQSQGSRASALEVVPLVLELLPVSSVVDVGCGVGTWLSVFRERGVSDVLGLDGTYVNPEQLLIPPTAFRAADLTTPPPLGRTVDLAISLEVAEHLPSSAADSFVAYLTTLAPCVLFSAAIPGQGGVNHVNEQWPEYWVERFDRQSFVAIDAFRSRIWHNERVQWWYAQNILLFARKDHVERTPALQSLRERTDHARLSQVHPRAFTAARFEHQALQRSLLPENMSLRTTLGTLPAMMRAAIRRRLPRRSRP